MNEVLEDALKGLKKRSHDNRVIRFFPETDFRCMHDGLRKHAMKVADVDPWELSPGQFLVFANKKMNKIKVFTAGNIVCYLKSPDDRRIDTDVIRQLPHFFNGKSFDFDAATQRMLDLKIRRVA